MSKWFAPIFLFLLLLAVFLANFTNGTWLSGWDNLMPELNLKLNLARSLSAVWQEYQGLGLVGGMGHATDLIRQLLTLLLNLILPANQIRYFWHFFSLFLGTYGIYFLFKQYSHKNLPSVLVASFYLLNFATVQNFWAPFEPFSIFWGTLPWLVLYFLQSANQPTLKNFFKLTIVNLLAIPSFYVPTVFLVYLSILGCLILSTYKKASTTLKQLGIILFLNLFWLLPFLYFFSTQSYNPRFAMGNLMANQETAMRNDYFGHFWDLLSLKGYYFNLTDVEGNIMSPWISFLNSPSMNLLQYFFSFCAFLGLVLVTLPKIKNSLQTFTILSSLLLCIALGSQIPVFSQINQFLRQSGLIDQVFRSPFTKFAPLLSLIYSLLIGHFLLSFYNWKKISGSVLATISFLFLTLNLLLNQPIFKGNFFYPNLKIKIPDTYFKVITYLNQKPDLRIANLPQGSFYGWTRYDFGMRGSGFLWYGLSQSILDRAFDVWNLYNESYYWQLKYAIETNSPVLLQNIVQKYNIDYILYDKNVFYPDEPIYSKQKYYINQLLENSPFLTLEKNFNNQIFLYKTNSNNQIFSTNTQISAQQLFNNRDFTFENSGDYSVYPNTNSPNINQFSDREAFIQSPNYQLEELFPTEKPDFFELKSIATNNLKGFYYPSANFTQELTLNFYASNLSGHPLTISAFDNNKKYKFFNIKLPNLKQWTPYSINIPAIESEDFYTGLTILFNSPSFDGKTTTNQIKNIKLFTNPNQTYIPPNLAKTQRTYYASNKLGTFFYKFSKNSASNNTLVLPQSFSPSWLAFYFDGKKPIFLSNHLLVNNWANGWLLPSELQNCQQNCPTIYFFFWPQILEFIGLAFIPLTFISIPIFLRQKS